jgi:hypothetical protein
VNPADYKDLLMTLILIPFALVVGTGVLFVFFAVRWSRKMREATENSARVFGTTLLGSRGNFSSNIFSQPSRWLAIKGSNIVLIQEAMSLHDITPCSWEEGLLEAREQKVFISPAINGWTLILGCGLPDSSEDVDRCYHFLVQLSRKLGHVQYFSCNRALNYHSWALLDKGEVFRAYAWAGETIWNQGQITAAERDLKMQCFDYGFEPANFSLRENLGSNCEKVYRLASRWSVDPAAIPEEVWQSRRGIVGQFSHPKTS